MAAPGDRIIDGRTAEALKAPQDRRAPADYYYPPGPIELDCCTAVRGPDGGWRHSRSCPFRRSRPA
jgi:hypothetical protein